MIRGLFADTIMNGKLSTEFQFEIRYCMNNDQIGKLSSSAVRHNVAVVKLISLDYLLFYSGFKGHIRISIRYSKYM